MRVFNHYCFRFLQQRLGKSEEIVFLKTDDSRVTRYYDPATPSHRQRLLFK